MVINYVKYLERQTNQRVMTIRCDGGGENHGKLSDYCLTNGIEMNMSNPYAHNQNAVVERAHRTIQEMAGTMLMDSGLPHRYWGHAVLQTIYIRNRTPMTILGWKTPHEALFKVKPSLKYLRRFGCKCFVHTPKERQAKIGHRSSEGIFLGNTPNGYRIKQLDTGKIIFSRDVIFDEQTVSPPKNPEFFYESGSDDGHPDQAASCSDSESESDHSDDATDGTPQPTPIPMRPKRPIDDTLTIRYPPHLQHAPTIPVSERPVIPLRRNPPRAARRVGALVAVDKPNSDIRHPTKWIEPTSIAEAKQYPEWRDSMMEELRAINDNDCFIEMNDLPDGRKALGMRMIFKIKTDEFDVPTRAKSRLVVQGFRQIPGVDFQETYSPVAGSNTIRILFAVSAYLKPTIHQYDVSTAYLNGVIDTDIYVQPPKELHDLIKTLPDRRGAAYWKLQMGLYGLRQSGRIWNQTLTHYLRECGLTASKYDPCLFYHLDDHEYLYLIIYVDDILIFTNSPDKEQHVTSTLTKSGVKLKFLGSPKKMIGLYIDYDERSGKTMINQTPYVEAKLSEFGLTNPTHRDTPGFETMAPAEIHDTTLPYRNIVGSLLYAATGTRPDIAYAVSMLAQYSDKCNTQHLNAAKNVLRYLAKSKDMGICYESRGETAISIAAFADADFASNQVDRKSITGFIVKIAGAPVVWAAKKQTLVSQSTTEAELIALSAVSKMITWIQKLLVEIGIPFDNPITVYEDNQSVIKLVESEAVHARTKHIDTRYFYIREQIAQGCQAVKYIESKRNLADIMTKHISRDRFVYLRDSMGIRPCVTSGSVRLARPGQSAPRGSMRPE
jgi:hypothetical protein